MAAMKRYIAHAWSWARRGQSVWRQGGWRLLARKGLRRALRCLEVSDQQAAQPKDYASWLISNAHPHGEESLRLRLALAGYRPPLRISLLMALNETTAETLCSAIEALLVQSYADWQLSIVDDESVASDLVEIARRYASLDDRIVVLPAKSGMVINEALAQCTSELVMWLTPAGRLAPQALALFALAAHRHPGARLFYADEDELDEQGRRCAPCFKPDWNPFLLLTGNYIGQPFALRRTLALELGGLREGFSSVAHYDLLLRAAESLMAGQVVHIPQILYHGLGNRGADVAAGQHALIEHLARRKIGATVEAAPEVPCRFRILWHLPATPPRVSVLIPTRDGGDMLRRCLARLFDRTRYPNFEVIVIDNGSRDAQTLALLREHEAIGKLRVLRIEEPFNFSRLNNAAVREASGEFVVLLNDDIEIVTPQWLSEMLGPALLPEVGAVGARLWYPDGRLQHGGVIFVLGVAGHAHRFLPKGKTGYCDRAVLLQNFAAVTGACLLVRKSVYLDVGGLDETLTVAFNDIDFCLRLGERGLWNVWTPYAEMVHHESASRGQEDTPEKRARFHREIEIMQARWGLPARPDPASNPNLATDAEDFSLAFPPPPWLPAWLACGD